MVFGLAYAAPPDDSGSSLNFILICAGMIIVVCAMALLPIAVASKRSHPQAQNVNTLVIAWGVLACGTLIYVTMQKMQWSKEYASLIESGYWNPQDTSPAPTQPWIIWAGLAAGYAALVIWAFAPRKFGDV